MPYPLHLLHGWAMNSQLFQTLHAELNNTNADRRHIQTHDLPGHGHQPTLNIPLDQSLNAWSQALLQQLPDKSHLLGWSLGGRLAIHLAYRYPQRIQRLILIAANPCFIAQPDWPHAMPKSDFQTFSESVQTSPEATLKRFLALQVRGSTEAQKHLRQLRQAQADTPPPSPQGLKQGLHLLKTHDARAELAALKQPILAILGARDPLMPAAVADSLQQLNSNIQIHIQEQAAHAPFLSHPDATAKHIHTFLAS